MWLGFKAHGLSENSDFAEQHKHLNDELFGEFSQCIIFFASFYFPCF